jgi:methylmalonyl-CoA mutase cobalamin-binding subunit
VEVFAQCGFEVGDEGAAVEAEQRLIRALAYEPHRLGISGMPALRAA